VILLDTHVLLWLLTQNRSLGQRSRAAISRALGSGDVAVSATSFWEIAVLVSKGRISVARSPTEQRASILESGILEIPLNGNIALRAADLEGLSADPIDRFIAATALVSGAVLMTADEAILRWRHSLRRQDASK